MAWYSSASEYQLYNRKHKMHQTKTGDHTSYQSLNLIWRDIQGVCRGVAHVYACGRESKKQAAQKFSAITYYVNRLNIRT